MFGTNENSDRYLGSGHIITIGSNKKCLFVFINPAIDFSFGRCHTSKKRIATEAGMNSDCRFQTQQKIFGKFVLN
jgi:hypothetical protein